MKQLIFFLTISLTATLAHSQTRENIRPVPNSALLNAATKFLDAEFILFDLEVQVPDDIPLSHFQALIASPTQTFREGTTAQKLYDQYHAQRNRAIQFNQNNKNLAGVRNAPEPLPLDRLSIDMDKWRDQIIIQQWITIQQLGLQVSNLRQRVSALENP